jgi:hypothetical protein
LQATIYQLGQTKKDLVNLELHAKRAFMKKYCILAILILTSEILFGQYIYRKPVVKKLSQKEYKRLELEKHKKDRQNKRKPFVYKFV